MTSVLQPPLRLGPPTVVSYQSFYDSLNPEDEPSYAISGGLTLRAASSHRRVGADLPAAARRARPSWSRTPRARSGLLRRPRVRENTLDSLRAALSSPATGLTGATKVGLERLLGRGHRDRVGGGAGTAYAPDINSRHRRRGDGRRPRRPCAQPALRRRQHQLGGRDPDGPDRNLPRVCRSTSSPYLSEYGQGALQRASARIDHRSEALYPGPTWAQLAKPQYQTPESVPVYVQVSNQLIMGSGGTPTAPLFIGQGAGGELEGTPGNKPGIGRGDGVMIAGDVRSLAREYCGRGVPVRYVQYEALSHVPSALAWLPEAATWLNARFAGPGSAPGLRADRAWQPADADRISLASRITGVRLSTVDGQWDLIDPDGTRRKATGRGGTAGSDRSPARGRTRSPGWSSGRRRRGSRTSRAGSDR